MTAQTLAEFHKAYPPDLVGQNKGHIWEGGQTSIKGIWGAPFCPFIQGGKPLPTSAFPPSHPGRGQNQARGSQLRKQSQFCGLFKHLLSSYCLLVKEIEELEVK